ncbi:hypothetical protein [Streptomyces niger]|uniref:hypothetical protein n=1 Tax=Streptomyces niger TaxID=66373 RepID=UPI000699969E|nr:hypothetical protein [Streptomyces niger]
MTEWSSWTTTGVIAGPGGVATVEAGAVTGDVTVHTTWSADDGLALVAVQYTGASDWFTMAGGPAHCASEAESRDLHQAAVEAARRGGGATVPAT